jgi:hypothetical protein
MDLYPRIRHAVTESDLFRGYSRERRQGETVARSLTPAGAAGAPFGPGGRPELVCAGIVTARPCSGDVGVWWLRGLGVPKPHAICQGCADALEAMGVPIGRRDDDR